MGDQAIALIEQIPDQYRDQDQEGVEHSIRRAYYEVYQVSGLEAQIDHRLGSDCNDAFVSQLLSLRTITRQGAPAAEVETQVSATVQLLRDDITEMLATPEISDQWSRVATRIITKLDEADQAYQAGQTEQAARAATDAYLAHYEADGLEKATIAYIGQGRVGDIEAQFNQLRQKAKDSSASVDDYSAMVDQLKADITEDATKIDQMTSTAELGWSGFFSAFIILLREGAEALLVVAAVMTYAMKAGRKDQILGILVGVVAALAIAVGLAVLFTELTTSRATGLSQELIEGITGFLAVIMLIWVSNWILSKSSGKKWEEYIERAAGKGVASGGVFALGLVAFLAVLREGAETILFFAPILAGAKTAGDHTKIWMGVGSAAIILALVFMLVWVFGIRLPMKQFFKWTSVLLALLAITIAGGAVKELQDATLVPAHPVDGVPQVTWLGLYPNVETLMTQLVVTVILVLLGILQYKKARKNSQLVDSDRSSAICEE